jgi:hypothetical protein
MTSDPTHTIPLPTVTEQPQPLEPVTPDTFLETDIVEAGVRDPRPKPPNGADPSLDR